MLDAVVIEVLHTNRNVEDPPHSLLVGDARVRVEACAQVAAGAELDDEAHETRVGRDSPVHVDHAG